MTPLLQHLLTRLDAWVSRKTDPVVQAALATSPASAQQPVVPSPRAAVVSHCNCCAEFFAPAPCPIIHWTPCDKAECGQWSVPTLGGAS